MTLVATQVQSNLPLPSLNNTPLRQHLLSPSGLTLVTCLVLLGLLALVEGSSKAKLATGRWAKAGERRRAWRLAIQQMKEQTHNRVALSIGVPGDRTALHLPDMQRGTMVIGAPGTGKTFGLIDPLITSALLQNFPIILYDFKYPGQTARLAPLAQHLGYDVRVFAPGFSESECCNPLDFLTSANDTLMARQLVVTFTQNARRDGTSRSEDVFFTESGEQLTTAVLMAAKGTPFPDLLMAHSMLRLPNLPARLQHGTNLPMWNRLLFDQLLAVADSERTAASIIGTTAGYFNRLLAPALLPAFIGETTLPLDLTGRQLIILGMDKQRREAVGSLLATVLHLLITRNVSQQRSTPLVVAIDELPTLYLPNLVNWLNQYREQGLTMLLAAQNLSQLKKTYHRDAAKAIFGACATKALFNPGEPDSAQQFSAALGEEEVRYTEIARSRGSGKTSINRSQHRRTRKLFEPAQFLKLPTGTAILISPGFGSKRERSLPLKTAIQVPAAVRRMLDSSEQSWARLRSLLIARRDHQPVDDDALQARLAHAEQLLPAPPPGGGIL